MAKYRLLHGKHAAGRLRKQKIYRPGDIIISDYDLLKQNHPNPAVPKKFELIEGSEDVKEEKSEFVDAMQNSDNLDSMTITELENFADTNEVDLKGISRKKADIIAAIREHGSKVTA